MFNIVLFNPEIPPNTGNIIRLCANTGSSLHLIHPLGFDMSEKSLRRAGLDYHQLACVHEYKSYQAFIEARHPQRLLAFSTRAKALYTEAAYQPEDYFLFGSETSGLPESVRETISEERMFTLPMQPQSRSLNLSNAVSIVTYEAWRQLDFVARPS